MPAVSFTKENLLERKQLKAGWRKLKVKSISEGPGKSDPDSTVYPVVLVIDDGEDLGTPVNHWFTEKQMGRLSEFVACFTGGVVDPNKEYSLDSIVGRHIMGYCEFDIKTGFNVIKDFKPFKV
jgi:hypothetical protein